MMDGWEMGKMLALEYYIENWVQGEAVGCGWLEHKSTGCKVESRLVGGAKILRMVRARQESTEYVISVHNSRSR
jgi:hypothetical protein